MNRISVVIAAVIMALAVILVPSTANAGDSSKLTFGKGGYSATPIQVDGQTLILDREYSVAEVKAIKAREAKGGKTAVSAAVAPGGGYFLLQSITSYFQGRPLESIQLYWNGNQFMGYERHETASYGIPFPTTIQICSTYQAYGVCKPGYVRTDSGVYRYYAGPVYTPQYGGCQWLYGAMNFYGQLYQHVIQGHCG